MGGESHEIIIHFQQANWNCFLRGWSMLRLKVALELLIADPCILIGAILSTDLHSVIVTVACFALCCLSLLAIST